MSPAILRTLSTCCTRKELEAIHTFHFWRDRAHLAAIRSAIIRTDCNEMLAAGTASMERISLLNMWSVTEGA